MSLSQKIGHVKGLCGRFFLSVWVPLPSYDPIPTPPTYFISVCSILISSWSGALAASSNMWARGPVARRVLARSGLRGLGGGEGGAVLAGSQLQVSRSALLAAAGPFRLIFYASLLQPSSPDTFVLLLFIQRRRQPCRRRMRSLAADPTAVWRGPPAHHTGKRGRGDAELTRDKFRGAIVHSAGRKYRHDWLNLQTINSIKH